MKSKLSGIQYTDEFKLMLIVGIILMMFFFGIKGTTSDILRPDEQTTLGHIGALETHPYGMSLLDTINSLAIYSAQHPPLYFLSANLWGKSFSFHSHIISLMSVFWGVLALAIFYRLAKDVGGYTVAFYAVFLLATSTIFVFYTHDIRQYASLMFWTGLTWLMYHRLCYQTDSLAFRQLALLTVVTMCAIYTHYTVIFILIVMGIYHLLFVPKTKAWWQISVAIVLAGVFYLPWVPTMLSGLESMISQIPKNQYKIMDNYELVSRIIKSWANGQGILFVILMILGVVASFFNYRRSRYALFFFTSVSLVILVINGNFEFIKQIRYVLILLLPFYLFGGFGLAFLHRWRVFPLIFLVVWVMTGTYFQSDFDYKQQTQLLVTQAYVEYNYLVPALQVILSTDDLLVTVVKAHGTIKASKQGKMSIEEYYLSPLNIQTINIYGQRSREKFVLDDVVGAIEGFSSFWITYRSKPIAELVEFLASIENTYRICETMRYGENSKLEHYVLSKEFENLCTDLSNQKE